MSYLSELLPYEIASCPKMEKGVYEYKFLLSKLQEAVDQFLNRDFERFDSIVGENGCHIRAIMIALVALNHSFNFDSLQARIQETNAKIETLLQTREIARLSIKKCSLLELFNTHKLDILLTPEELFLVRAYLLTLVKDKEQNCTVLSSLSGTSKSCPKKLIAHNNPNISVTFVNRLTDKLRAMLSESSVQFIRDITRDFNDPSIEKMVSEEYSYKHNAILACTPLFWTFKALLNKAHKEAIPIVMHVKFITEIGESQYKIHDQQIFFFKPQNQTYIEVQPSQEDFEKAAFVIEGIALSEEEKVTWRRSMDDLSLLDLILANTAAHRQYPDPAKDQDILNICEEYERYKDLAAKRGFSLDNPHGFLIQHIYAAQLNKIAV